MHICIYVYMYMYRDGEREIEGEICLQHAFKPLVEKESEEKATTQIRSQNLVRKKVSAGPPGPGRCKSHGHRLQTTTCHGGFYHPNICFGCLKAMPQAI